LPLAMEMTETEWLLLDGSTTRIDFLDDAIKALGLAERVSTLAMRAEDAGRRAEMRGGYDLLVARSFGPPAATAECSAPLLHPGGLLIVAEPPGGNPGRWPADGLASLGMRAIRSVASPSAFQMIEQVTECPEIYPRRNGIPAKRPLF
jgi:16S rRNA (guanine527-N7)-methyltransferase